MRRNHTMVVLDKYAVIVDFESTIERLKNNKIEIIGQNWFDIFVESDAKTNPLNVLLRNFFGDLLLAKNLLEHMNKNEHQSNNTENPILLYDNGKKSLICEKGRTFLTFGMNKYFVVNFFHNETITQQRILFKFRPKLSRIEQKHSFAMVS